MIDEDLHEALFQLVRVHTYVQEKALHKLGLRPGQAAALGSLGRFGPMNQSDLAKRLFVSNSTISIMLGRMEKDELIVRVKLPDNKKENVVFVTPKGKKAQTAMEEYNRAMPKVLFEGLTDAEKSTLLHALETVKYNHLNSVENDNGD